MNMLVNIFRYPGAAVAGLLAGLVLLVPMAQSVSQQALLTWDRLNPVVSMSGMLVQSSADEVVLSISGVKHRDCQYLRITAYTEWADGSMRDAYISRIDMPEKGETKPKGNFHIGSWRVWPRAGGVRVLAYVHHLCGSRMVTTKVADVPLDGKS